MLLRKEGTPWKCGLVKMSKKVKHQRYNLNVCDLLFHVYSLVILPDFLSIAMQSE